MAAITASMVAELRAKTDAPMMECKKALTEAEGNLEKAEEILRNRLRFEERLLPGIRQLGGCTDREEQPG